MKIHLCVVGKLRNGPEKDLVDDYLNRFEKIGRSYGLGPVSVVEVEDKKNGEVHTPKPDCFLNGITRQTVLNMLSEKGIKVHERHIMPEELETFEQCWLTGTAAEVTPVNQIGNYNFEVGNLARDISEAYEKLVRT